MSLSAAGSDIGGGGGSSSSNNAAIAAALEGAEQLLLGAQQQQLQQQTASESGGEDQGDTATRTLVHNTTAGDLHNANAVGDGAGGLNQMAAPTRAATDNDGSVLNNQNVAVQDAGADVLATDAVKPGGSTTIVLIAGAVIVVSVICSIFLLNTRDPVEQSMVTRVVQTMSDAAASSAMSHSQFGALDAAAAVGYTRGSPIYPMSPLQNQLSPHQYHPGVGGGGNAFSRGQRYTPSSDGDGKSTKDSRQFAAGLARSMPASTHPRIKSPLSPGAGSTGTGVSQASIGSGTMTETLLLEAGLAEHNIEEFETYQLVSRIFVKKVYNRCLKLCDNLQKSRTLIVPGGSQQPFS